MKTLKVMMVMLDLYWSPVQFHKGEGDMIHNDDEDAVDVEPVLVPDTAPQEIGWWVASWTAG